MQHGQYLQNVRELQPASITGGEILAIWARFLIGDRVKTQAIVTGGTEEARADGGV